ncbi:MAG: hypothetical protein ACRELD_10650 [Longimicrobiales bacterium]
MSRGRCRACAAPLLTGAHFCTQCGARIRDFASTLPWYVAAAAVITILVVLVWPAVRADAPDVEIGGGSAFDPAAVQGAPPAPPPLTGTPREQADRLFNRVMEAQSRDNAEESEFFLPMAIAAYERVPELDADGLYHLSLLQTAAGRAEQARSNAERILATSPRHLLALAAAAQAAERAGDESAAAAYWRRLLDAYATESGRALPEYTDHRQILPQYRAEAERALAGAARE